MKISNSEALAAAENLRKYCRKTRCPDCPFSRGDICEICRRMVRGGGLENGNA